MGGVADKQVDVRKVGLVAAALALGLTIWQWPDISDFIQTNARNSKDQQETADIMAKYDAKDKARKDALKAREQAVGVRGALDEIMAKNALTLDDLASLREALETYAYTLGPGTMSYKPNGNPLFKGPQATYLLKVFRRTQETATGDLPPMPSNLPTGPSSAPVAASTGTWHTIAHFTGRSIKNTPKFDVPDEWRIRWTAKGNGVFQIYAYGPDGMPEPAANIEGSGSDESYMHKGGSYYLDLNTSERYEVWVEAQ